MTAADTAAHPTLFVQQVNATCLLLSAEPRLGATVTGANAEDAVSDVLLHPGPYMYRKVLKVKTTPADGAAGCGWLLELHLQHTAVTTPTNKS